MLDDAGLACRGQLVGEAQVRPRHTYGHEGRRGAYCIWYKTTISVMNNTHLWLSSPYFYTGVPRQAFLQQGFKQLIQKGAR